jgi:hypothetical protein
MTGNTPSDASEDHILRMIDALAHSDLKDFRAVEAITHVPLGAVKDDDLTHYEAKGDTAQGAGLADVRYWAPVGSVGAVLRLSLARTCLDMNVIKSRFGKPDFIATSTPPDPSKGPAFGISRSWGEITFEFSSAAPNCLDKVIIEKANR